MTMHHFITTPIKIVFMLLLCVAPVSAANPNLPGDVNNDNQVNILDYNLILQKYGTVDCSANLTGTDCKIDLYDYSLVAANFGRSYTPTPPPTATPTPAPTTAPTQSPTPMPTDMPHPPSGGGSNPTGSSIVIRHPYQFNAQPALTYEAFDVTFWVNNWSVSSNGSHVHMLLEEMSKKTVKIDHPNQPFNNYITNALTTFNAQTCDAPIATVRDEHVYNKGPIGLSGLKQQSFYRLTLELANPDHSMTGIKHSVCFEVNRPLLEIFPHVNETTSSNTGGVPAHLKPLQAAAANANSQGTVPPCPDHDPQKHHFIYDQSRNCHYDHEHKDDPNQSYYDNPNNKNAHGVNRGTKDALGTFGEAWAWMANNPVHKRHVNELPTWQTLSYPWQTWHGVDTGDSRDTKLANKMMENDLKHNGYGWLVRSPNDFRTSTPICTPTNTWYIKACITHIREQYHAVAGMPGALTHTHSFWIEARVCTLNSEADGVITDNECGIYRGGGHLGFGRLGTNRWSITKPGQQELMAPFWTDGPSKDSGDSAYYTRIDGTYRDGGIRLHGAMSEDDVRASARDFTWYPEGRESSKIALVGSSFGPLLYIPLGTSYNAGGYNVTGPDYSLLRRQVYYCQDPTKCRWPNGGQMEAHFSMIFAPHHYDGDQYDLDGKQNGFVTFYGYTNRWGERQLRGECNNKPLGPDCVPLVYENVPVTDAPNVYGEAQFRDSSNGTPMYNYDIAPAGKYWIQFPN